jgi:hypothetical protein
MLSIILLLTIAGYAQENRNISEASFINLKDGVVFEVSPYTGAMGKSGVFGLRFSMNYSTLNLELSGSQVIGKTANLYPVSFNLLLNLSTKGHLLPYGALGAGLFITTPTNAIGAETVSTMAINFGGGLRYYITRSFGLRFDVKQFVTSVTEASEGNDELLIFQEFSLGVTFMLR